MVWPFRPRAPLPADAKRWVEARLAWLCRRFRSNVFTDRPLILPERTYFPEATGPWKETASRLFDRVCRYMLVPRARVDLVFFDESREAALGLVDERGIPVGHPVGTAQAQPDGRFRVRIGIDKVDAVELIGTMAHELSHVRLGMLATYRPGFDDELTTDLLAVVSGFGVFVSAGRRPHTALLGTWPGTQRARPEYMTPAMFGYALAHLAWLERDHQPAWRRHLAADVATNTSAALKYLIATQDSTFDRFAVDALPQEDLIDLGAVLGLDE